MIVTSAMLWSPFLFPTWSPPDVYEKNFWYPVSSWGNLLIPCPVMGKPFDTPFLFFDVYSKWNIFLKPEKRGTPVFKIFKKLFFNFHKRGVRVLIKLRKTIFHFDSFWFVLIRFVFCSKFINDRFYEKEHMKKSIWKRVYEKEQSQKTLLRVRYRGLPVMNRWEREMGWSLFFNPKFVFDEEFVFMTE